MSKFGVALSGGAIRGVAHLGMIKRLQETGITFSHYSGTSSGAIAGVLLASGLEPDQIVSILEETSSFSLIRPAISFKGFLKIDVLEQVLKKHLQCKTFAELSVKVTVSATLLRSGETIYFDKGDILPALMASSCIPVLFKPMKIGDDYFVDGGIINNLPIEPLVDCDKKVGMLCNPVDQEYLVTNMKSLIERTLLMTVNTNTYSRREKCDLVLEPAGLSKYPVLAFSKVREIYNIGYQYVQDNERMIKEKLELA